MNREEDFPVLMADVQNGAAKQTRTFVKKMHKKGSQAKAKQEHRTHGEVARVGRTVPTFAKIGPQGMRETTFPWWRQLPTSTGSCGRRQ